MSLGYAWEKCYVAVQGMASSSRSLQDRICDAYSGSLMRLQPTDIPVEQRVAFAELQARLTRETALGGEGTIRATTNKMTDEDASKIAEQIVDIYDGVARAYGHAGIP